MGTLLLGLGGIMLFIGWIWLVIEAFKVNILWGIGCILLPIIDLIFAIIHWEVAKKPFGIYLTGFILVVLGTVLFPHAQVGSGTPL